MNTKSLIANTGIQFLRVSDVEINFDNQVAKKINFYEDEIDNEIELEPVYYFSMNDKYVKRRELISAGFLDPFKNTIEDENNIQFQLLNTWDRESVLSINSLDTSLKGLLSEFDDIPFNAFYNKWLPLPYFDNNGDIGGQSPSNWIRLKMIPKSQQRNRVKVDFLLAIDTTVGEFDDIEKPFFYDEKVKEYSLCGYNPERVKNEEDSGEKNRINDFVIPHVVYEFCSQNSGWINEKIKRIMHGVDFDISNLEKGKRLKYLAYYIYFVYYLQRLEKLPTIKLYSNKEEEAINVNLILDIGNSRTYGLLAEDPLNESFSNAQVLSLTDLSTGNTFEEPFDMRLAFRNEKFGGYNEISSRQFLWPSILSLGKEAERYIYNDKDNYISGNETNTYYSSPKRYLWDAEPYVGQWEFSQIEGSETANRLIDLDGVTTQFYSDGSLSTDPTFFGSKSSYSRRSLMTFSFIEILLQANLQINSFAFRERNGREFVKRKISRVVITSPTAMPKKEQIALRQCAEEASIVLSRFYDKTDGLPIDIKTFKSKMDIIPKAKDLALPSSSSDEKHNWGYDEATCCQMVYLYSELKRFLGNSKDLFDLYGHQRRDVNIPGALEGRSLTVGSLDIGAGTTDIMICNYSTSLSGDATITPMPLYWDSFRFSGDDLVKALIIQIIIEDYAGQEYLGCSGVIANKLKERGDVDARGKLHNFFDDTSSMSCLARKMRSAFNVQISIPLVYRMLEMYQNDENDKVLAYEDIFVTNRPQQELLDFFETHFGFRFEELNWKFSVDYINSIIQRVFEPNLRKWSAVLNAYGCDVVLLGGRPTSLQKVYDIFLKLYAVDPNRLISMNNYRVGNWYPGTDGVGYFGDRKSLVAVGALISYLAEVGKLKNMKLNTNYLKDKVISTSDYIGYINPRSGEIPTPFFEPTLNHATITVDNFPIYLGTKQMNVSGYPTRILYCMDINEERIKEIIKTKNPDIDIETLSDEVENYKHKIKSRMPLNIKISREFREDKEVLEIEYVTNNEKDDVSPLFIKLKPQSLVEDVSDWLNTGKFILKIG